MEVRKAAAAQLLLDRPVTRTRGRLVASAGALRRRRARGPWPKLEESWVVGRELLVELRRVGWVAAAHEVGVVGRARCWTAVAAALGLGLRIAAEDGVGGACYCGPQVEASSGEGGVWWLGRGAGDGGGARKLVAVVAELGQAARNGA